MAFTFILSDDSINSYGFRVLTKGIDLSQFKKNPVMLFMHNRSTYRPTGDEVIGRWENIRIEDGKLLADAVFDETNDFAVKIKKKVEGGFIKMASIGFTAIEWSEDKKDLIAGQKKPTVTKSKIDEASIVDIGSNDSALRLYNEDGEVINLAAGLPKSLKLKTDNNMNELVAIALALGLVQDATQAQITEAIGRLKADKEGLATKLQAIEDKQKEEQTAEATQLINEAKALKLIDDAGATAYEGLFEAAHENAKATLSALIAGHKNVKESNAAQAAKIVGNLAAGSTSQSDANNEKDYDWYQKNDSKALLKLKHDEPDKFIKLYNDFHETSFSIEDFRK